MTTFSLFAGIDISKKTFNLAIYRDGVGVVVEKEFPNSEKGWLLLERQMSKHSRTDDVAMYCMENTGSYSDGCATWLHNKGASVWVEHAMRIKRSFGNDRGKDDAMDARRIAEYAWRFKDRFDPFVPLCHEAQSLKALLVLRESVIRQRVVNSNALKDLQCRAFVPKTVETMLQRLIESLREQEDELTQTIASLLPKEGAAGQACAALMSLPGVATITGAAMAVHTNYFRFIPDGRQLASYLGISPQKYESGTSVSRRPRSAGYGPSMLRYLLHLVAKTMARKKGMMRAYYLRKKEEGKHDMIVLNAMRNKIAHMMCAVMRSGTHYMENYRSIEPRLLMN